MPRILEFAGKKPRIAPSAFVAPGATVVGDVVIAAGASVWFGAVLRGDCGRIRIGERSNIQDLACIHMTTGESHTEIGADVTVGHGAIIHGAIIENGALVGMGAVVLDNAEIGEQSLIAAGSVVTPRTKIPARSLVRGSPARVIRELSESERELGRRGALAYEALRNQYRLEAGSS